ncbi:MAG: sigma-70 family RNA polymerase sigma factor [Lachnospiraceae bacterium]|nr:sigma-70 family RNA polymerase sigma factor [Lachnospiraceae bacterium]
MKRGQSDHDKAAKLYERYEHKMYDVAYSILHDEWQAEDVVSEAFIKLIQNLSKIKDVDSKQTKRFVIRMIQSTAIDQYRKNQRERVKLTHVNAEQEENVAFPDNKDDIEDMLRKVGSEQEVEQILAYLPQMYREVFMYRCMHEFSVRETAAVLEISENLVRKRYERARNMLAKKLGDEQYAYKII